MHSILHHNLILPIPEDLFNDPFPTGFVIMSPIKMLPSFLLIAKPLLANHVLEGRRLL